MQIPTADGATLRAALVGLVFAMGGGRARADESDPAALELEARGGLMFRNDAFVDPDSDTHAQGQSASQLALSGRYFPRAGAIGIAAWGDATRLSLRTGAPDLGPGPGTATAGAFAAALAGRLEGGRGTQRWSFIGALGWSGLQLPVAVIQADPLGAHLAGARVRAHGPIVGATAGWRPHRLFAFEVSGDLLPVGFGARIDDQSLELRRWRLGVTAVLADVGLAGSRLSAVLGFVHGDAHASTGSVHLTQVNNELTLGLRARWAAPPALVPNTAETPSPAPAGRLVLLVRAREPDGGASEVAAVGVTGDVLASDGRRMGTFVTDEAGQVSLVGLSPGPIEVRLGGVGWQPAREIFAFPALGVATAKVALARLAPPARGSVAISGQVRAAGAAVAAHVRIPELGVEQGTGADGGFHFDVAPGRYTLVVEAPGFVVQRKVVDVGRSEQQIYDLELAPVGR